jgi:bifunctional NMN adenylyltransferase/nudix hydrolase
MDKKYNVGVIVGRFQLNLPHPAHTELINNVISNHYHTVVLLGLSAYTGTEANPLDFRCRKVMLQELYPNIDILYIEDVEDDHEWSRKVDSTISKVIRKGQTVCLYGGRDSFIKHYDGQYPTQELLLNQSEFISATGIRKDIYNSVLNKEDFRKGIIYQSANKLTDTIPHVISIVFDKTYQKVLIGQRVNDKAFSFLTSSIDAGETLESTAIKIIVDKIGVTSTAPIYKGSFIVDDWKLRSEKEKILGMVFTTTIEFGRVEALDEYKVVKWVSVEELPEVIGKMHNDIAKVVKGWQF